MRPSSMRASLFAAAIAVLAVALQEATAAGNGSVIGTVTARGLRTNAGIVVSLEAPRPTPVAPSAPAIMDQKDMLFVPRVLAVARGTTVRFLNSDPLPHNVFSPEGKYNLGTWPQGQTKQRTFNEPGVYAQLCRVHPEMEAFVVVLDTPYFATTDKTGAFAITDVAPGAYTLVAWSDRLKTARSLVTVEAGQPTTITLTLTR